MKKPEQHKTFKQNWSEVDEVCSACGQVTKVNRGFTKQNIKKLFRKPSSQDCIIFIVLALLIFGAWAYQSEVEQYKEIVRHPQELCQIYFESVLHGNFDDVNLSNILGNNLIEDGKSK